MKRPKLFTAFEGDAPGLRDVLIEHFRTEANLIPVPHGETYGEGVDAGRCMAFHQVVRFLKTLVINETEHQEDNGKNDVS